jgi:hypothetical protein
MTRVFVPIELLEALADVDDCWFDHHGGCQAHGYLSLEPGEICPQQELKDTLIKARQEQAEWNEATKAHHE